jgi:hypothetical protein
MIQNPAVDRRKKQGKDKEDRIQNSNTYLIIDLEEQEWHLFIT